MSGTASVPHNLPLQLTSFVGRGQELREVARLLTGPFRGPRLLTLTGAGGCGKTRFALQVAGDVCEAFVDGVWLVELAPLADPAQVPRAVASVLGVQEPPNRTLTAALVDFLRPKSLLLLLDNCEHVVEGSAELAEALLRSCPNLRILATTREILGAAGETAYRVPSLRVPDSMPGAREKASEGEFRARAPELLGFESVELFVDRARAMRPDFVLTEENALAVTEICRRLDGIPLAIELAAARVRVFAVDQIATSLADCFRLLAGGQRTALPRQQTLRGTVDWSYELLAEPERAVLRRLSVFAGGWTLKATEAVCAGDGIAAHAVLDLLALLVDKSLVQVDESQGGVRYRLLEMIRQYAREKLEAEGEVERTQARHLGYFLRLAEEADLKLQGPDQRLWLDRMEVEHDNFRAALRWSLAAGETEASLRLGGSMAWFWWCRSYLAEGRGWLTLALTKFPDRSAARMRALHGAGWLAHHQYDSSTARLLLDESLALARELSDPRTVAWVLHLLGRVAYFENDPVQARVFGHESLAVAEEVGDRGLIAWALHLLGLAEYIAADYPKAQDYYARSLTIRRENGYPEGIAVLLHLMGTVAFRMGDAAEARRLWRENLAIVRELGMRWQMSFTLAVFCALAASQNQPVRAVRLAGATALLSESYHGRPIPLAAELLREGLAQASEALDEAAYARAWDEGRALSFEGGIAEVLAVEIEPGTNSIEQTTEPQRYPADLTAAEVQVLRLLSSGRTTREIAAELVVAVSTVDRHLTHIYSKLGVRNRAAATHFALRHGLA